MDGAARLPFEAWYFEVPIVTRAFITASVLTSIAVVKTPNPCAYLIHSNAMSSHYTSYSTVGELLL